MPSADRAHHAIVRTQRLTFAQASDTFRAHAAKSAVQSAGGGTTVRLPSGRIRVVLSYVRAAAEALTGTTGAALDQTDCLPLLAHLLPAAQRVARERGEVGSAWRSRKSNVALFVRTIAATHDLSLTELPLLATAPAWHSLIRALGSVSRREALVDFEHLCQRFGVGAPQALPGTRAILAWAGDDASLRARLDAGLAAYRIARVRVGANTLPACPIDRPTYEYGIRSLPFLAELLAATPELPNPQVIPVPDWSRPEQLPSRLLLQRIAPHFERALAAFEQQRHVANNSRDYVESGERALSRIAAAYARYLNAAGEPIARIAQTLQSASLMHLWTLQVSSPASQHEAQASSHAHANDPDLDGLVPEAGAATVSLLHALIDTLAARSYHASPLQVNVHAARLAIPLYTPSLIQVVRRLFAIARDALKPKLTALGDEGKRRWQVLEFEQKMLLSHMTVVSRQRLATGQVDKRLLPIHYAEVVCIGLPALRAEAMAAEREMDAWLAGGNARDSVLGQRVIARFDQALLRYMVTAILVAEGLREKNLRGARMGWQILPEYTRDALGRPMGVARVTSCFRGDDPVWVRLKQTHEPGGGSSPKARVREWSWAPGIVDHGLLFRYLRETRSRAAQAAGLVPIGSDIDLLNDRLALFISPKARSVRDESTAGGNFARQILSDIFGRALFWMAKVLLQRPGLPESYEEARTMGSAYRGLFGAHMVRSLGATWWGGLRNRWDYAEAYTNDLQPTLHAHYSRIPSWMARAAGSGGPADPTWWNGVLDVVVTEQDGRLNWGGFWEAFDPEAHYSVESVRRAIGAGSL